MAGESWDAGVGGQGWRNKATGQEGLMAECLEVRLGSSP